MGVDSAQATDQATLIIRAMINAAKSDGEIDETEREKIITHLGDVSDEEAKFLRTELAAPLNTEEFIRSVPRGMENQVYLMSLTAIDLDSQAEAKYLQQLAQGLRISEQTCNQIHEKVGAVKLYS
jgi:uncharacterized membrane protein YebE (DUF533 family)